jgi:hypothetical protein
MPVKALINCSPYLDDVSRRLIAAKFNLDIDGLCAQKRKSKAAKGL